MIQAIQPMISEQFLFNAMQEKISKSTVIFEQILIGISNKEPEQEDGVKRNASKHFFQTSQNAAKRQRLNRIVQLNHPADDLIFASRVLCFAPEWRKS